MGVGDARRKWLGVALRVLATLGIFGLIFWRLPAAQIGEAMGRMGLTHWLALMPAFGLAHVVAAQKWRMLVRVAGVPLGAWTALRAHAGGLFANIWLPSIIGGDVVRAGWVARTHGGIAVPALVGVADRALDLAALLTLAAAGAILVPADVLGPAAPVLRGGALALAALGVGGVLVLLALDPARLPARLQQPASRVREVLLGLAGRPATALAAYTLSVCVQGALVALNVGIAQAIGVEASPAAWLLAWPLAKVVALIPVSLGGLGVREAALAGLLAPFGVPATLAVAQGLVWQSVLFGFGLVAGALVFATRKLGVR